MIIFVKQISILFDRHSELPMLSLIDCLLLLILWVSVFVPCFVMQYIVSFLVLQSKVK